MSSIITRNLRDAVMVILDGSGSPKTLTLVLDEGDLSWQNSKSTIEVLDRGVLHHTRPGDEVSVSLSYSAKWTQLIGRAYTASEGDFLYEMVNNTGSKYTSVAAAGEQFCLIHRFTINDPKSASNTSEQVQFNKVYMETCECSEGDEYSVVNFSGRDFETAPTVTRV